MSVGVQVGPEAGEGSGGGGTVSGYIPGIVTVSDPNAAPAVDNTAAILSYLNSLTSGGAGDLILPPGYIPCNLTGSNAIPEGTKLKGAGSNQIGKTSGVLDLVYGSTLIPFTTAQTAVVELATKYSSLEDLNVFGLIDNQSRVATNCVLITNDFNRLTNVGLFGSSTFCLNTSNAHTIGSSGPGQVSITQLYANTFSTTGSAQSLNANGHDWFVDNCYFGGGGVINISGGLWSSCHFTANLSAGTSTYTISELGGSNFAACYFDSFTPAGAVSANGAIIDRTGATDNSTFSGCHYTVNTNQPSGSNIFRETSTAAAGAIIEGGYVDVGDPTWVVAFFLKGSITSTVVRGINLGTVLAGASSISNIRPPAGQWSDITYIPNGGSNVQALNPQSGSTSLSVQNGTSFAGGTIKDIFSETNLTTALAKLQKGTYRINVQAVLAATVGDLAEYFLMFYGGSVANVSTASTTATYASSTTFTVASATGLLNGMIVYDQTNPSYISAGAVVTNITGTTVTVAGTVNASMSGDTLSFNKPGPGGCITIPTTSPVTLSQTFLITVTTATVIVTLGIKGGGSLTGCVAQYQTPVNSYPYATTISYARQAT